jgi:hypothetical protein
MQRRGNKGHNIAGAILSAQNGGTDQSSEGLPRPHLPESDNDAVAAARCTPTKRGELVCPAIAPQDVALKQYTTRKSDDESNPRRAIARTFYVSLVRRQLAGITALQNEHDRWSCSKQKQKRRKKGDSWAWHGMKRLSLPLTLIR